MSSKSRSLIADEEDRFIWRVEGAPSSVLNDIYYLLMASSWLHFFLAFLTLYTLFVAGFALIYWFVLEGIKGARPGSFSDAFFFSVHTFSTIGFGSMYPNTLTTQLLVFAESFCGMACTAVGTGMIFSKFSRPTAHVSFSKVAVIHRRDGDWMLVMRMANRRLSEVTNVDLHASVITREVTSEGESFVSSKEIPLVRNHVLIFMMGWNAMHRIDESSPLWPLTQGTPPSESLVALVLTFEGTHSTYLQRVQAAHIYRPEHIRFNETYVDMLTSIDDDHVLLYDNLSRTVPVEESKD